MDLIGLEGNLLCQFFYRNPSQVDKVVFSQITCKWLHTTKYPNNFRDGHLYLTYLQEPKSSLPLDIFLSLNSQFTLKNKCQIASNVKGRLQIQLTSYTWQFSLKMNIINIQEFFMLTSSSNSIYQIWCTTKSKPCWA